MNREKIICIRLIRLKLLKNNNIVLEKDVY